MREWAWASLEPWLPFTRTHILVSFQKGAPGHCLPLTRPQ